MDTQLETYEYTRAAAVVEPARNWQKVGREPVYYPDDEGITIPTWLFASFIGLVTGMVIGPAIMATTKGGSERLAELSRRYIAGG